MARKLTYTISISPITLSKVSVLASRFDISVSLAINAVLDYGLSTPDLEKEFVKFTSPIRPIGLTEAEILAVKDKVDILTDPEQREGIGKSRRRKASNVFALPPEIEKRERIFSALCGAPPFNDKHPVLKVLWTKINVSGEIDVATDIPDDVVDEALREME